MTDLTSDPFELETQTGLLRTAQAQGTCGHNLNEPFLFGLYIPRDLVNGVDEIHGVALHGVGESIGP